MCLAAQGHFDDALSCVALVHARDPNNFDAHRTRGVCLLRTDHAAEALEAFDFALKGHPRDVRLLAGKGAALVALGRNGDALRAFTEATEAEPEDGDAWRGKGFVHLKLEAFSDAALALSRATAVRPGDKSVWYMRGFAEEGSGDYEAAGEAGERTGEERVHLSRIDSFAEAVVRYEKQMGRPATREEVFKFCSVPLEDLDEVLRYVNEPATLAPDRLAPHPPPR